MDRTPQHSPLDHSRSGGKYDANPYLGELEETLILPEAAIGFGGSLLPKISRISPAPILIFKQWKLRWVLPLESGFLASSQTFLRGEGQTVFRRVFEAQPQPPDGKMSCDRGEHW